MMGIIRLARRMAQPDLALAWRPIVHALAIASLTESALRRGPSKRLPGRQFIRINFGIV